MTYPTCPKCGFITNWGGKHCPFCGKKLNDTEGDYWTDAKTDTTKGKFK